MASEIVEFVGSIKKVRFKANDSPFKICTMRVSQVLEGKIEPNEYGDVVFKGEMDMLPQTNYLIKGKLNKSDKYGNQYDYVFSKRQNPIEDMSAKDFRVFLTDLSAKGHLINEKYEDPRPLFQNHDIDALTEIQGIGLKTATILLEKYEAQKDYSLAYVAFGKYGFNMNMTRKIVNSLKSVDLAIRTLDENPYEFMSVQGIGFKTIDEKAMKFGISVNDTRRVHAFISNYFNELAMSGSSWVTTTMLIKHLEKEIFNCDIKEAVTWINDSDEFIVFDHDGEKRIATRRLFNAERNVSKHLIRLRNARSSYSPDENWQDIVKRVEIDQGWSYSEKQKEAIEKILNENVILLRGVAGSGKTSTLNAVVKVLQAGYQSIATCALSGKAADNLTQITGSKGKTIHRLLGILGPKIHFNEELPLPYDVVILDEVSMVDVDLFSKLIAAIRDGAKFIMVGDSAQLDSIGVGVMSDIVRSKEIPVITLKEIHRQAKESAIITHSLTYRMGKLPPISEGDSWKRMGTKKDLGYVFEGKTEEDKIVEDVTRIFRQMVHKYEIKDVQMLASTIKKCDELNKEAQIIANPADGLKNEYVVYPGKEYSYTLREGDKIINIANNYRAVSADNESVIVPIYNGNTGILESVQTNTDSKGNIKDVRVVVDLDGIGRVALDNKDVNNIRLGYAITVHKSQGSTIPCVIIALPFQYMLNSRELLYTAITRSSKECYLATSMRTLKATVAKTSEAVHHSSLADLIKKASEENGTETI